MIESAFNGDTFLQEEVKKYIKEFNTKTAIETGTWKGRTAEFLSSIVDNVITIEIDKGMWEDTSFLRSIPNVRHFLGSSPEILDSLFRLELVDLPVLFYLDAHWLEDWPLLNELDVLIKYNLNNSVIVIHDFYNPINLELGYDSYKGVKLDFDYIKEKIEELYKDTGYNIKYNIEGVGEKRGVIFITSSKED